MDRIVSIVLEKFERELIPERLLASDGVPAVLVADEPVLVQRLRDGSLVDVPLIRSGPVRMGSLHGMEEAEIADHVDGGVVVALDGTAWRADLPEPMTVAGTVVEGVLFGTRRRDVEVCVGGIPRKAVALPG